MAAPSPANLPSFKRPPVNEVICGLTFRPIEGLLAPHLGILWNEFREEYPDCKEVDPLIPVIETFDGAEHQPPLNVSLLPRIWFISKDENGIIQVQRDRFLHNWRKMRATDEYPRYDVVIEKFRRHVTTFRTFLSQNELGAILPEQFEMTYLNHIPLGDGWESLRDIGKIFPDFCWRSEQRFLGDPEKVNWRTSFLLPEKVGRLHVSIQNAHRRQDNLPVIVVELTVRGISRERTIESIWDWFGLARQWIVRGFADITGTGVQQAVWKKEQ